MNAIDRAELRGVTYTARLDEVERLKAAGCHVLAWRKDGNQQWYAGAADPADLPTVVAAATAPARPEPRTCSPEAEADYTALVMALADGDVPDLTNDQAEAILWAAHRTMEDLSRDATTLIRLNSEAAMNAVFMQAKLQRAAYLARELEGARHVMRSY